MGEFPNPYREKREPNQGELEVIHGQWLLLAFRFLKVPMPRKSDAKAIARVGVLLQRRFPWLIRLEKALAKHYAPWL